MNCIVDGCTFQAATNKGDYCEDHCCAYRGCKKPREKDIYCSAHVWHMDMIEYHGNRIEKGVKQYGERGGVLRDPETLELLPKPTVARVAKPVVVTEPSPIPAPVVPVPPSMPLVEAVTPVASVQPEPPKPPRPPRIKPKVVRAKREPTEPKVTTSMCRTRGCHLPAKEIGFCQGCGSLFLIWRRYTLANLTSPMTPSLEQADAFKATHAEMQRRTGT